MQSNIRSYFPISGFYRVKLLSSHGEVISISNVMTVSWGDYYELSSTQESVFPCNDKLTIEYARPKCGIRADNIHMYAMKPSKPTEQVIIELPLSFLLTLVQSCYS